MSLRNDNDSSHITVDRYCELISSIPPNAPLRWRAGESAHLLEMFVSGHMYITTVREVLLTAFTQKGCRLRNQRGDKRITGASNGLMNIEGSPRGAVRP